jgi:alkylation response protein AidB-like acyl-CoA dehydrogenase
MSLGGRGYRDNGPLARLMRDAQAAHVMSPTTHLLKGWLGGEQRLRRLGRALVSQSGSVLEQAPRALDDRPHLGHAFGQGRLLQHAARLGDEGSPEATKALFAAKIDIADTAVSVTNTAMTLLKAAFSERRSAVCS